jgi:hypothetical protein
LADVAVGLFEQHFEAFRARVPSLEIVAELEIGRALRVQEVALPTGWSKSSTNVTFVCPVGYPLASPDCFWTDADLRLANGSDPQNTGVNPIPGFGEDLRWFSWHCPNWNPNRDTLLTWYQQIRQRLAVAA